MCSPRLFVRYHQHHYHSPSAHQHVLPQLASSHHSRLMSGRIVGNWKENGNQIRSATCHPMWLHIVCHSWAFATCCTARRTSLEVGAKQLMAACHPFGVPSPSPTHSRMTRGPRITPDSANQLPFTVVTTSCSHVPSKRAMVQSGQLRLLSGAQNKLSTLCKPSNHSPTFASCISAFTPSHIRTLNSSPLFRPSSLHCSPSLLTTPTSPSNCHTCII